MVGQKADKTRREVFGAPNSKPNRLNYYSLRPNAHRKVGIFIFGLMLQDMAKAEPYKNLRDLYPGLTETELQGAEENLEAYLELLLRIYERIESDPAAYVELKEYLAESKRNKKSEKNSR